MLFCTVRLYLHITVSSQTLTVPIVKAKENYTSLHSEQWTPYDRMASVGTTRLIWKTGILKNGTDVFRYVIFSLTEKIQTLV